MPIVSLSTFRFDSVFNRAWVFSRMGFDRGPLRRTPGIGFAKLFGSGTGEGFTPVPNTAVWGLMASWPSLDRAREAMSEGVFARWRDRSVEAHSIFLAPLSSRGKWDGEVPFLPDSTAPAATSLLAVVTRATVKLRYAAAFWSRAPDISAQVREQDHIKFKIGLGEVPWLHQVTFSVWDDQAAMTRFAYGHAFHGEAVKAVRAKGWFKEELYARFVVLAAEGAWEGREPLAGLLAERRMSASEQRPGMSARAS